MEDKKPILNRAYLAAVPFALVAIAVLVKLMIIQFSEGPELRAQAAKKVIMERSIKAERGNIYSVDGQLLATTMPVYDIYFDPVTVSENTFSAGIAALSRDLAAHIGKSNASQWERMLRSKRQAGVQYVPIVSNLNYSQYQKLKTFPIFNKGRHRGGLIAEQQNLRIKPQGKVAERTIGRDHKWSSTGLEGAFAEILEGQDGKRLMQKVSNQNWKPVTDNYEIEPQDGYDIVTTLNARMQDVVHHELLKALEQFEADHGCAVVMEVKTGAIRAIANLGRTDEGTYFEKRNYAVWESTEPGSTFKLASVMAVLEDGIADTNTTVDTEDGRYKVYDRLIRDSNGKGYGKISLKKAFEVSSNVGIVKLINDNYKDQPQRFVDRFYTLGMHKKLGLPIKGEGSAKIPKPGDSNWSGLSLPWMAFGYQVSFTPLQLLTFYNAVANNGVMVKPRFLEETRQHGRTIDQMQTEVLNPAICSEQTLLKLQNMLEGVVKNGTATNIYSEHPRLAGKTGTCQLNYWKESTNDYQASFAGYFPADKPLYSCIVVINKPNYHRGYYGSAVAAPVFKAIAENIYASLPLEIETQLNAAPKFHSALRPDHISLEEGNPVPNLKGKDGSTVISELENKGFKVKAKGNGKVLWQYPPAGSRITQNAQIELKLG